MNILLAPAIYLALALLLAVVLGRRLRAMQPPAADTDLDAPYELLVEPPYQFHVELLTPAEREAMWARIEARLKVRCATPGCPVMIPDDGRRLCHFDRKSAMLQSR